MHILTSLSMLGRWISSANRPRWLDSQLCWANCLLGSLQPKVSFDHYGINSTRSSGNKSIVTEIVELRFFVECCGQSLLCSGAVRQVRTDSREPVSKFKDQLLFKIACIDILYF